MTEIKYKGLQFQLAFQEYHSPLPLSFWCSDLYFKGYQRLTGTDVGFVYQVIDSEFVGYMQDKGSEIILNALKSKLSRAWMDTQLVEFDKHFSALKELVEGARTSKYNRQELIALFESLYKELSFIYPYSNAFYLLSSEIERVILDQLKINHSVEESSNILAQFSHPIKPTFLVEYSSDTLQIAQEIKNKYGIVDVEGIKKLYEKDNNLNIQIDALAKKYFCLTSINAGKRTLESFFPDIISKMMQNPKKTIPVPKEIAENIYLLKAMIYFKDELSTFVIPYVTYALEEHFTEAAKLLNLSLEEMNQLLIGEIISNLKSPTELRELVKKRKQATFFFHAPFQSTVITEGVVAQKEISVVLSQAPITDASNIKEITGKVGCAGQFTGPVQLLLKSSDIAHFKEGHVLVTVYTGPEFVPAMKKAGAIVTDTGGITCHAAIVSRELHKPCVVGAKIATKVLKDGDIVSVDANTGVIKIIRN